MSSVQELYAPNSICFGCGPANIKGLKIRSMRSESLKEKNGLWMEFQPEPHHEAFPGMVNGGIIGTLLDCHSNWTAAISLMDTGKLTEPPCTVTADFHVKLRAPTPSTQKIQIESQVVSIQGSKVLVSAELYSVNADGSRHKTATCEGHFVAVKEGHPAFHRWG